MTRLNVGNIRHPDGTADNISLDSSGRVGIGTTAVNANLHLHNAGGNATFAINNGTVGTALTDGLTLISATDGSAFIAQRENADLIFSTNNTEASRITSNGDLRFNSGYGSVATAYGVRAWINFDGTSGSIGTGRASGNCSSITDQGTGYYQFNFSSMVDGDYAVTGSVISSTNTDSTYAFVVGASNAANSVHSSSAFRFTTLHYSGNVYDYNQVQIVVVR